MLERLQCFSNAAPTLLVQHYGRLHSGNDTVTHARRLHSGHGSGQRCPNAASTPLHRSSNAALTLLQCCLFPQSALIFSSPQGGVTAGLRQHLGSIEAALRQHCISTASTSSATRQTTHRERNPGTRTRAELKQCCASFVEAL